MQTSLTVRYEEQDGGGVEAMQSAEQELPFVEEEVGVSGDVQVGKQETVSVVYVLVKHSQGEHRHGRVEQIVHSDEHRVKHRLETGNG